MIDSWPIIGDFIEIEAESEILVKKYSEILGFDYNEAVFGAVDQIYKKYFDISEDVINTLEIIDFQTEYNLEYLRKTKKT